MDYKIVTGYSLHTLCGAVAHALRDGWTPQGGPFVVDTPQAQEGNANDYSIMHGLRMKREFCQAMVKA